MNNIYILNEASENQVLYWGKLKSPVYAYLELTKHCNCNCEFCQVDGLHCKDSDISFSLFKKIIKELKKNDFFEIRLGGGEPLLVNDLERMLQYIYKNKLFFWICTNGILLNDKNVSLLKKYNCTGVRISIDSCVEEKHNKIRNNPNAFKSAWEGVDRCLKAQLETVVSMTIGNHNINEVATLASIAKEHGAKFITHPIMPVQRGKNFLDKNGEYFCCSQNIQNIISESKGEKHCVAASEMIGIDTNGYVSPCTFIKPKLSLKDIDLKKILNHKDFKCYTKPIPKSKKCAKCKYNKNTDDCILSSICRGGCWALKEIENEN